MPRSKRVVIDNLDQLGFENVGRAWTTRLNYIGYTEDHIAIQDDRFQVALAAPLLVDGGFYTQVTIWSVGLVSFGAVTSAQIDYMATLTPSTDITGFLIDFPGDWIAVQMKTQAYGEVEFGTGSSDHVADPFTLGDHQQGLFYLDPPRYELADAEADSYVQFGDEIIEGSPDEGKDVPSVSGSLLRIGVSFTEEGFRCAAAGSYRLGGEIVTVLHPAFVFFSDLNVWTGTAAGDQQVAIGAQRLDGGDGDDLLTGSDGADELIGGAGNDRLSGGGSVDRLDGGDGDDILSDGDERGTLLGGAGDDLLLPGAGEDTIDGGDGVDTLVLDYHLATDAIRMILDDRRFGYQLADDYKQIRNIERLEFTGGAGRDQIVGADGDDLLSQRGGGGVLTGRGGNDRLLGGSGRDRLIGGGGDDVLNGGSGSGPLSLVANRGTYDLNDEPFLRLTRDKNVAAVHYAFAFAVADPRGQVLQIGSEDRAGLTQYLDYRVVVSDSDGKVVRVLDGYYDDLRIVLTQAGRFSVDVSVDTSGAREFAIEARLGGVPISRGDEMIGGRGDDVYVVNSVDDVVVERHDAGDHDEVRTRLSSFALTSVRNVEDLTGDEHAQTLSGTGRTNAISGGGGDDVIVGGGGADVLTGGSGADTFVYGALSEMSNAGGKREVILDFGASDTISLRDIDAAPEIDGRQPFMFLGTDAFTGSGAAEVRWTIERGHVVVQIDADHDQRADASLVLGTDITLQASNFLL